MTDRNGIAVYAGLLSAHEIERFWAKISIMKPMECWPWNGIGSRYGQFYISRKGRTKKIGSHRLAYVLTKRALEPGEVIRHLCDNPLCCNPAHLEPGTQADNVVDKMTKGRQAWGERQGLSKLTNDQVAAIRRATGKHRDIAVIFGVHQTTISRIKRAATWRQS
jgi:hypothetical protein